MITTSPGPDTHSPLPGGNQPNGQAASVQTDWPVAEFHPGLGNHPLWQALLDEMESNRQTDIAEASRQADLASEE